MLMGLKERPADTILEYLIRAQLERCVPFREFYGAYSRLEVDEKTYDKLVSFIHQYQELKRRATVRNEMEHEDVATTCTQARADKRKDLARPRKEKEKGKRTRKFLKDFVLLIIVTVNAKTEQVVHILTNIYRRRTIRHGRVPVAVL